MICDELISLLYGSIVNEVITNSEHLTEANSRLQKIGYRIGTKIVDEFLRDSKQKPCETMPQLVEKFSTIAVKKFLPSAESRYEGYKVTATGHCFNLKIAGNPLLKSLEYSHELKSGNLQYQSILRGVMRGAFEILKFKADITLIHEDLVKNESIFYIELSKESQQKE